MERGQRQCRGRTLASMCTRPSWVYNKLASAARGQRFPDYCFFYSALPPYTNTMEISKKLFETGANQRQFYKRNQANFIDSLPPEKNWSTFLFTLFVVGAEY